MNKIGKFVQAAIANVALSVLTAAAPVALEPARIEQDTTLTVQEPVFNAQELYRPVLAERVPAGPRQRGDHSWRWWAIHLRRIKEGWIEPQTKRYICGYHYYYLNFVKIPIQKPGTDIISSWDAPYYRANDAEIFMCIWNNRYRIDPRSGKVYNAKNLIKAKPRTIGWTQIEFLGVDTYHFLFMGGRERYIGRAYPKEIYQQVEVGWFRTLYSTYIPDFLKTVQGRKLEIITDNQDDFKVGFKVGKTPTIYSWMQYRLVPNESKAGVFKSQRLWKITAIEAGLWEGNSLDNFYAENKDCIGAGDMQWGMMIIGGTSNAVINRSSNYAKMFFNYKDYGAIPHFTPKTKGFLGFIDLVTGEDRVEEARVFIEDRRRSVEHNSELLQKEKVENPMTPQEAFEPSTSFAYDAIKLQQQIEWVKANGYDQQWKRGKLYYVRDAMNRPTGRVNFRPDPAGTPEKERGPWWINMACLPRYDIKGLHIAGIDDTFKPKKVGYTLRKRDSRNCMIIYRQPTSLVANQDMPAALYYEKLEDQDATFHEFLKGMIFYDVKRTLYEYNQTAFITFLQTRHQSHRLFWVGNAPGIEIKGRVKLEMTAKGHAYMAEDRQVGITLLPLLNSLLGWGSGDNDDIGSAFHCVLHLLHELRDMPLDQEETESLLTAGRRQNSADFIQLGPDADPQGDITPFSVQRTSDFIQLGPQHHYHDAVYA